MLECKNCFAALPKGLTHFLLVFAFFFLLFFFPEKVIICWDRFSLIFVRRKLNEKVVRSRLILFATQKNWGHHFEQI